MKASIIALLCAASFSAAADNAWTAVSDEVSFRKGSYEPDKFGGSVLLRMSFNGQITFYRAFVSDIDCAAGYGKVRLLDIAGEQLLTTWDYVNQGGNTASIVGDGICGNVLQAIESATKSTAKPVQGWQ